MARRGIPSAGGSNAMVVVDSTDAARALTSLEWAIGPLSLGMWLKGTMAPFLARRASQRFVNEGDETIGRWSPLKEVTQEIRENTGFPRSHPINKRTGELEDYIVRGGADVALTPLGAQLTTPGSAATGELGDKLATAQEGRGFGGRLNSPHTVPRPVLGLGAPDLEFALVGLNAWVHQVVSARRGGLSVTREETSI